MTAFVERANPVIKELIQKWPNTEAFAHDLGVRSVTHVGTMSVRGSIPTRYWIPLIVGAKVRGIEGITAAYLLDVDMRANLARVPE